MTDYAGPLRKALALHATQYAQAHDIPFYVSLGSPPTLLFHPYGNDRHGNFHPHSYTAILQNPDWYKRLAKKHTAKKALPAEHQDANELDSSTSSDALLMNIFCHPDTRRSPLLAALLRHPTLPTELPRFGVDADVPLTGGKADNTELDLLLGPLHIEAKLTEHDFTDAPLDQIATYRDAHQFLDLSPLTNSAQTVAHYQLIRNILAIAHHPGHRFILLHDQRRPDLRHSFDETCAAIRDPNLRSRCEAITWQEIAFCLPQPLQSFLMEKYGIVPSVPARLATRAGDFDTAIANQALKSLYAAHLGHLATALQPFEGVSTPLLVQAPAGYAAAQIRLMVIGQQTFGWLENSSATALEVLLSEYEKFGMGENWKSTPFWHASHELYNRLNPDGPKGGFIWSNLIKVDQHKNRPDPEVEVRSRQAFDVLPGEIAILEPDVVVFFTGQSYRGALAAVFPGVKYEPCAGFSEQDLTRVIHRQLPAHTYLTHHPRTLRMRGLTDQVLPAIARLATTP